MGQTGGQILSEMDRKTQEVRGNLTRLNEKTTKILMEIEQERNKEAQLYLQLINIKVHQSEQENLTVLLSEAEKEAFRLFKQRDKRVQELDQKTTEIQDKLINLEEQRITKTASIEKDRAALNELRHKVLQDIQNHPTFLEIKNLIDQTCQQIQRVQQKIPIIQQDHKEKTALYHADPLFQHLWSVQYGTSGYNRQRLYRMLDHWVASVCRYEPARRNYAILSALPDKFEKHKQLLTDTLSNQKTQKQSYIEREVMAAGGQAYQGRIEAGQAELSVLDADLSRFEADRTVIMNKKNQIVFGHDEISKAATAQLDQFLKNETLVQLKINAAASPSPEDDQIVRGLYQIEERISDKESRLSEYQDLILMEEKRLSDIQSVRRNYKDRHYDRDAREHDGQTFGVLLGQFLSGILTSRVFWRLVEGLLEEVLDELDLDDIIKKKDRKYRKYQDHNSHKDDD